MSKKVTALAIALLLSTSICADTGAGIAAAKTVTDGIKNPADNIDPKIAQNTWSSFRKLGKDISTGAIKGFKTTREFSKEHRNEILIAAGTIAAAYVSYRLIKWAVAKKKQSKNK